MARSQGIEFMRTKEQFGASAYIDFRGGGEKESHFSNRFVL